MMLQEKRPDIAIKVPVNTSAENRREVREVVVAVNTDAAANMSFAKAAMAAGIVNPPTNNPPGENKQPPYLLIGGALILSYFLFFK